MNVISSKDDTLETIFKKISSQNTNKKNYKFTHYFN